MGAWQVWGSGGLVEGTCEGKEMTKSPKGNKKSAKGMEQNMKQEAKERKRRVQAPKERSGGSPWFPVRRK